MRYHELPVDVCFVSPLCRALETARILLRGRQIPLYQDERLKEMCFGPYEGTERIFDKPEHPLYPLFKDPVHYKAPSGAESFEALYERTGAFLFEKVNPLCSNGRNVLIVGHGAMNLSIYNRLMGVPLERFWEMPIKNCEIYPINPEVLSGFQ